MPASTPATRLIFQNYSIYTGPAALSGNTATGSMWNVPGVAQGAGNTGNNLIAEIANVTDASLSIDIPRQDLNIFGQLARQGTVVLTPPSIQLSFSYNVTDSYNEQMLGLNGKGGAFLSGILTKVSDSKNYFVSISQQGVDEYGVSAPSARDTIGIGNGFLSNYSINAAVGQVTTASVSVDALNVVAYYGSSGLQTPAVNPATSARLTPWTFQLPVGRPITGAGGVFALKPGDIVAEFPSALGFLVPLSGSNGVNLQSFSVSVPISRSPINRLGSLFGFSREIQFPLNCTINLRALQTEIATGALDVLLCNDQFFNGRVRMKQPACPGSNSDDSIIVGLNQMKVTNLSFGMTVGGDATVDLTATCQLGGALSTDGLTMSGAY